MANIGPALAAAVGSGLGALNLTLEVEHSVTVNDPATATVSTTKTTETPRGAVVEYDSRFIDGERIQQGDLRAIMEAQGFQRPVKTKARVRYGGAWFSVLEVKRHALGEYTLAYELQLRGA